MDTPLFRIMVSALASLQHLRLAPDNGSVPAGPNSIVWFARYLRGVALVDAYARTSILETVHTVCILESM